MNTYPPQINVCPLSGITQRDAEKATGFGTREEVVPMAAGTGEEVHMAPGY